MGISKILDIKLILRYFSFESMEIENINRTHQCNFHMLERIYDNDDAVMIMRKRGEDLVAWIDLFLLISHISFIWLDLWVCY